MRGGNDATKKLLTFSNKKGETVSYIPDLRKEKSWDKHFNNIVKAVKNNFGVKDVKNVKFTYNPFDNAHSIEIRKSIGGNTLSKNNLEQFWNVLESHKSISVMNFIVGDIVGKQATIICVESLQSNNAAMVLFRNEEGTDDIDDYDWDTVFNSQFIPFIKRATLVNKRKGDGGDDGDDVDYDELPFKIYKIGEDNEGEVWNKTNLLNFDSIRDDCNLDEEIADGNDLEECYDDKESGHCYFFVENKNCFVASYDGGGDDDDEKLNPYYWKPGYAADNDDIDWEKEFLLLKKDLCQHFSIINNSNFEIKDGEDEDIVYEEGDDLAKQWIYAYDDSIYLPIIVNGDPLMQFVIDCGKCGENSVATKSIALRIDLDLESDSNHVFEKFSTSLGSRISKWQSKFKLIDSKSGQLTQNGAQFLKLCQSYNSKNVSPIEFRLESKVFLCFCALFMFVV